MATLTFELYLAFLISGWAFASDSANHVYQEITAKIGDNVPLDCGPPRDAAIVMLYWNRLDLNSDDYVFFYRDGQSYKNYQHPQFQERVRLSRHETITNVVTLYNATLEDNGIYVCHIQVSGSRAQSEIKRVKLTVKLSDQMNKTAKPGDNITLSCQAPSSTNIRVVQWKRPDLVPQDVVKYQDGRPDPDNQHPSFKDRVELEDSKMKDGDVSLVLRNVTINDSGTYECRVVQGKTTRRKRYLNNEPISTIYLDVKLGSTGGRTGEGGDEDGGDKDGNIRGNVGLIVCLSLVVVVVVVVVVGSVLMKYKRHMKKKNPHPPHPPDEEAGDQQLL